ncbi:MAG: endonuclease III [Clostridiales bacterium]|nr:endonuclease III [Clostridiales bacterium]
MNKKQAEEIVKILIEMYPEVDVTLNFSSPFELLICLILAAQCTDKRVNEVTANIFDKYNKPQHFANMDTEKIEEMIHSCGFYRNKAKNIKKASQQLLDNFNGIVPDNMEDLQTLAGIGRKSANCILADAFKAPVGVAIDTHAKRICNRLGISDKTEPTKIEQDLINLVDKKYWQKLNLILVTHGRQTCDSRNPKCEECKLNKVCKYYINMNK